MTDRTIRPMTRAELDTVLGWAEGEGWNPGLDDADPFYAADPGGFLVAELAGAPVASLSIVRSGGGVGFLGLFICRSDRRGEGHGHALWTEGLARLAPGDRPVGLDGVPAQQEAYARSGFVRTHRTIRFAGALEAEGPDPTRALRPADIGPALALDHAVTGHDRGAFLRDWLTGGARRWTRVLERDGAPAGVATLRACVSGYKVGPVFAEDARAAADLLAGLAHAAGGTPLSIDMPEPNSAAVTLAERHGLVPVFETARMWRGTPPAQDLARTFGVATLELG